LQKLTAGLDLPLARAAPEKLNQSKPEFSEREAVGWRRVDH